MTSLLPRGLGRQICELSLRSLGMGSMIDRQVTRLGVTDQEIALTLVTMKRKMDEMTGLVQDLENMVGT